MKRCKHRAIAPSNIAFIKYWGKRDANLQWPANDSLSMTLANTNSTTTAHVINGDLDQIHLNGNKLGLTDGSHGKIVRHLDFLRSKLGFTARLLIDSSNNFPSDCGIASSASGFAALTIASIGAWTESGSLDDLSAKEFSAERLANLARMGSGSAGRSLMGGFVKWHGGNAPDQQHFSSLTETKPWDLADIIVVVSKQKKPVSSTDAHKAAWTSLLFEPRLATIETRMKLVTQAIQDQDLKALGPLLETEALEMHGVIMSARPAVCYMTGATSSLLAWVRQERTREDFPAWFTLDAGPNVHLICERQDADRLAQILKNEFNDYEVIVDHRGAGPHLSTVELDNQ
jgi:diphosphomevalonate decarboxylase